MKDIIPAKKESPILGLSGMGGGVGSNIVAGLAEEAKYIDQVFSPYLYYGTAGSQSITTGLDMTRGGLTWIKTRSQNFEHGLFDSERGNNILQSNSNIAQVAYADGLTSFNNDGFTLGADTSRGVVNQDTWDYLSWNFREQKGFFDIVTWTGNGVDGRQISHNLGCVPGFVMIKCTSAAENWACYHRDWTGKVLELDTTSVGNSGIWKNTLATDTYISVNAQGKVNGNGETYVGYFFAGGASTAANARSVDFGSGTNYLSLGSSPDFDFGTGDFTVEAWCYREGSGNFFTMFDHLMGSDQFIIFSYGDGDIRVYSGSGGGQLPSGVNPGNNRWFHCAVVRQSGTLMFFIDGVKATTTHSFNLNIPQAGIQIGRSGSGGYTIGKVSNLRVVKGTAVYTTSFKPSTEPLTAITNTKLLCCNNSSVTGSTVTPGTITNSGAIVSADNPFNDPECYKFGENEDQNLIACGTYGGHNSEFPEITNLGWEPQWVMIKRTDSADNWVVWDSQRGLVSGSADGNDNAMYLDLANSEGVSPYIDLMPNGFKLTRQSGMVNNTGSTYSYVAIRRPDALVGKPPEAGTDVFNIVRGNGSSTVPANVSGFGIVDFRMAKNFSTTEDWWVTTRLSDNNEVNSNNTQASNTGSWTSYKSNEGEGLNWSTSYQAWLWKRHAGLDVVTYVGTGAAGRHMPHNLSKTPEMIWVKNRSIAQAWKVYHKGFNGGTNPQDYSLNLNDAAAKVNDHQFWNDTAPTSNAVILGTSTETNHSGSNHIMWLFASVDGISKVGSYTGTGASGHSITLGFQPRFLLVKNADRAGVNWIIYDTLRGWTGTNDKFICLNQDLAEGTTTIGPPTSTGFTVNATNTSLNASGETYIYYAHA